jgi:hypothetical protein
MGKTPKYVEATISDAKRLFEHSEGFRKAEECLCQMAFNLLGTSGTIHKNDLPRMGVVAPVIVISAIRLELLLKVLSSLDHAKYPPIHELDVLFDGLSAPTKKRLRDRYDELMKGPNAAQVVHPNAPVNQSIEWVLQKSSAAFIKFRYYPSKTFADLEGFIATEVTQAALMVIREDHPEWWPT